MKILGLIEIDSKGISIPLVKIHIPFQLAIPILIFFAKPATAVRTTVKALDEGVPCSARIAGDITNDGIKDLVVSCNEDTTPWSCLRYSQAENSMIPFSNTYINEPPPSNYFYLTTQAARDLMSACEADGHGHLMTPPQPINLNALGSSEDDNSEDFLFQTDDISGTEPLIFSSQPVVGPTTQEENEPKNTVVSRAGNG